MGGFVKAAEGKIHGRHSFVGKRQPLRNKRKQRFLGLGGERNNNGEENKRDNQSPCYLLVK